MGMQSTDSVTEIILAAVAVVGTIIGSVWKVTRVERALGDSISDAKQKASEADAAVRQESSRRMDEHERIVGEGLNAMRQKANDVEIWNRDNFVRRSDFQNALDSINRGMESLRSDIGSARSSLEAKIEKLADRPPPCANWKPRDPE